MTREKWSATFSRKMAARAHFRLQQRHDDRPGHLRRHLWSGAAAINTSGDVVGTSDTATTSHAFLYGGTAR